MARRSAQTVLRDLAEMHDLMNEQTGKIHYSGMSKRTGIPHPTLIKIMQSGPDTELSGRNIRKLCEAFHITLAQASGYVPIRRKHRPKFSPTDAELELIRRLRKLDRDSRGDIERLIDLREELSKR